MFKWYILKLGCSSNAVYLRQILSHYKRDGVDMLLKVFDSSDHLEQLSGIADLKNPVCMDDLEPDLAVSIEVTYALFSLLSTRYIKPHFQLQLFNTYF